MKICWTFLLLFAGCAMVNQAQVNFSRFFEADAAITRKEIELQAKAHGYTTTRENEFQRTMDVKRDPVFGIIPISDDPAAAFLFSITLEENKTGTLVNVVPQQVRFKRFSNEEAGRYPMGTDFREYRVIKEMVETAAARARAAAAK